MDVENRRTRSHSCLQGGSLVHDSRSGGTVLMHVGRVLMNIKFIHKSSQI